MRSACRARQGGRRGSSHAVVALHSDLYTPSRLFQELRVDDVCIETRVTVGLSVSCCQILRGPREIFPTAPPCDRRLKACGSASLPSGGRTTETPGTARDLLVHGLHPMLEPRGIRRPTQTFGRARRRAQRRLITESGSSMAHRERHRSDRIGWLRAAVLGANDGIVSTASLVVGVAAADATHQGVLVAGIAGLVAGALSMAAGEYVSVSSQADTEQADLERERRSSRPSRKRRRTNSRTST